MGADRPYHEILQVTGAWKPWAHGSVVKNEVLDDDVPICPKCGGESEMLLET